MCSSDSFWGSLKGFLQLFHPSQTLLKSLHYHLDSKNLKRKCLFYLESKFYVFGMTVYSVSRHLDLLPLVMLTVTLGRLNEPNMVTKPE